MYVCEGMIVKTSNGREGKVIGTDRNLHTAAISNGHTTFVAPVSDLQVVSYKGVK